MKVIYGLLLTAFCITGCVSTMTLPVVVIEKNGHMMKGTTTATSSGDGSFNVTDGVLMCGGSYNSTDPSSTISMPVTCSDGRRGIVITTRDGSGMSGSGSIHMTDGSEATFMFGRAAASF